MIEITPEAGVHLSGSGMGEHRPAQSVIDPLYAKAVVFESVGRRLCILALDLTIIAEEFTSAVRQAAAERYGLDPDALMVHGTQTHSAPSCGVFMLDPDFPLRLTPEFEYLTGSESAYTESVAEKSIRAIGQALDSLQPVRIGAGRGMRADLAFNRRGVMRDGRVTMPWPTGRRSQPLGPTQLCHMEGPTDPEVGVFCARNDDLEMVAMLLHYTCHPVSVFGTKSSYHAVSADWPGDWAARMQRDHGGRCVPLVVNGCCGNINPWDPFDPDFEIDHRRQGEGLAEMADKVIRNMSFSQDTTLDWRARRVPLPYREVSPERQAEVDEILLSHPQPKWLDEEPRRIDPEWFHAASTKSIDYCRKRMPEFQYEIQVFRIGDVALVGLPGEPFVEGQLQIKVGSPAGYTFVAHMISHYVGYLPTSDAYARGGHEANDSYTYWAKLAPGSLETVVEEATKMTEELFGDNG